MLKNKFMRISCVTQGVEETKKRPIRIIYPHDIWLRTCALVDAFEHEVGWVHSIVPDDRIPDAYRVTGVFVHKQVATRDQFTFDSAEFNKWGKKVCMDEVPGVKPEDLRMIGHSHHEWPVYPMSQRDEDVCFNQYGSHSAGFTVAIIINKHSAINLTAIIHKPVKLMVACQLFVELPEVADLADFIKDAKSKVTTPAVKSREALWYDDGDPCAIVTKKPKVAKSNVVAQLRKSPAGNRNVLPSGNALKELMKEAQEV